MSMKEYEKVIAIIGGLVLVCAFFIHLHSKKKNFEALRKAEINEVVNDRETVAGGKFNRYTFNKGEVYIDFYPKEDPLMIGDSVTKDSRANFFNIYRKQNKHDKHYFFVEKYEW